MPFSASSQVPIASFFEAAYSIFKDRRLRYFSALERIPESTICSPYSQEKSPSCSLRILKIAPSRPVMVSEAPNDPRSEEREGDRIHPENILDLVMLSVARVPAKPGSAQVEASRRFVLRHAASGSSLCHASWLESCCGVTVDQALFFSLSSAHTIPRSRASVYPAYCRSSSLNAVP
jgi:hypothetical protein